MDHDETKATLESISEYWDDRSEGYDAQVKKEEGEGAIDAYLEHLGEVEGKDVLDIGCGPGFFAVELARRGARVTAVDISSEMLQKTLARARAAGVELRVLQADCQALDFGENSFDLICSRNVVWNLAWPREAYEVWWKMLRSDGRIVVFDGNHYRHYFDEAYARARQAPVPKDNHIMLGVSPERIDQIARMLPMVQVDRPGWDWSTFVEFGAGSVEAVPLTFIQDPESGRKLVYDFVVVACK